MKAQRADMFVCPMASPSDTSGLQRLADERKIKPDTLVALAGKTEGTGAHDDWGRVWADVALREWTAEFLGIPVGEVDAAARKVLRKAGLGRYFTHSTGHGVGLEIHESPRVANGQPEILQPGMVITIEPGVYFPGKWGLRIEDMVAVTAGGCEVITPTSKDFLAV